MADYQNKPLTGVLFRNQKKSDNHPDVKGHFFDDKGEKWEIAGWVKTSKNGNKYTSLSISEPYQKPQEPKQPPAPAGRQKPKQQPEPETDDEEDGLPF